MLAERLTGLVVFLAIVPAVEAERGNMISLHDSLEPLALRFNEQKDSPRIVAILSPT